MVTALNESGKNAVKEALGKMKAGEAARDTIDDKNTIAQILAGTGITKDKIGPGLLEFNLTGHWRIFAYKTGKWEKTIAIKDKFGKPIPNCEPLKQIYEGTYWPVKIGHLEANRCITPSNALV